MHSHHPQATDLCQDEQENLFFALALDVKLMVIDRNKGCVNLICENDLAALMVKGYINYQLNGEKQYNYSFRKDLLEKGISFKLTSENDVVEIQFAREIFPQAWTEFRTTLFDIAFALFPNPTLVDSSAAPSSPKVIYLDSGRASEQPPSDDLTINTPDQQVLMQLMTETVELAGILTSSKFPECSADSENAAQKKRDAEIEKNTQEILSYIERGPNSPSESFLSSPRRSTTSFIVEQLTSTAIPFSAQFAPIDRPYEIEVTPPDGPWNSPSVIDLRVEGEECYLYETCGLDNRP